MFHALNSCWYFQIVCPHNLLNTCSHFRSKETCIDSWHTNPPHSCQWSCFFNRWFSIHIGTNSVLTHLLFDSIYPEEGWKMFIFFSSHSLFSSLIFIRVTLDMHNNYESSLTCFIFPHYNYLLLMSTKHKPSKWANVIDLKLWWIMDLIIPLVPLLKFPTTF